MPAIVFSEPQGIQRKECLISVELRFFDRDCGGHVINKPILQLTLNYVTPI